MTKLLVLFSLATAISMSTQAATVNSEDVTVSVARVVKVVPLVQKNGLQVSVVVQDLGGSTDVSPTQTVYLTLYAKGEMFSTDATFKIANVLSLISAKRVSGGVYEIKAMTYETDMAETTYTIDATKAVTEIKAVDCDGDFDCEASQKFTTTVQVKTRHSRLTVPL